MGRQGRQGRQEDAGTRIEDAVRCAGVNPTLIDKYLPEYHFSEYHDIVIESDSVERVYEIARDLDMSKSRIIPFLFRLRGLPTRRLNALGFISSVGFSNIEHVFPRENLIGYWKKGKILPVTNHGDFVSNAIGATQKVVFSFQFASLNPRQVKVSTETRVQCIGWRARMTYWFYWLAIRPWSGLIRRVILRMIKYEAELGAVTPDQGAMKYPKQEMVAKVPAVVLFPLRIFFQVTARVAPRLAVSSFKSLLSRMPRKQLNPAEEEFLRTAAPIAFHCGDCVLSGYSFGKGPTVLVVHGLLGNSANYRTIIPALVEQGFRVVAFDSINHGKSPDGISFSSKPIRHLESIIGQLGDIHAVVSHSAGTYLVMMALLKFPAAKTLKKCVYIATFPDARVTLLTFMDYFWVPKRLYPPLCRWFEEIGGLPFDEQSFGACLPRHRTPDKPDRLFVHDKDDRQIPFIRTREMLTGDRDAELFVTEGLGHFKILRDPKVVERIVNFLKQ